MSIDTDLLSDVKRAADPLKHVIIPEDDIMLIKALSFQHPQSQPQWGVDFIEGKGLGKIVLLHGPPGVGKTYTVGMCFGLQQSQCITKAHRMHCRSVQNAPAFSDNGKCDA